MNAIDSKPNSQMGTSTEKPTKADDIFFGLWRKQPLNCFTYQQSSRDEWLDLVK
jgi:hypothetical protein